jgi:hypothetical protein
MSSPRLKVLAAAAVAVTMGLATAGCTDDDPPRDGTTPSAATSNGAVGTSMTFEEAYRKLPMDGTTELPITWELSGVPDTGEVLAARRSLVFHYWDYSSTDWAAIVPIGRFLYTEAFFEKVLAPFATSTNDNPSIGPIWVKVMGVEKNGADKATVTFCTDRGYWHRAKEKNVKVPTDRANLESYVMENVESGDGERHWLTDQLIDNDGARKAKYDTECTKWAQHRP